MRIALDARTIYSRNRRGTGKNLLDLYTHMARLRPSWEFLLLHQVEVEPDEKLRALRDMGNVRSRKIDVPGDRWQLWRRLLLPRAAARAGADALHCPANLAAGPGRVPQVVTIHDLIPLDERFNGDPASRRRWRRDLRIAARRARAIITPSHFSRTMIELFAPRAADKIHVNPWAADSACREVSDPAALEAVRRAYLPGEAQDRRVVLAFGGADPRKNTPGVLAAWAATAPALRRACWLLIVGVQDPPLAALRDRARELGLADCCTVGGFADEADLPALISAAAVLFYPSLSEGFGLPVLDGFACGTPVVCSETTSLPEVAGDAAELTDPEDPAAMAAALQRVLGDADWAEELTRRGRQRLGDYAWTACAQRAAAVFEGLAAGSPKA